jgi:hypothetical protein
MFDEAALARIDEMQRCAMERRALPGLVHDMPPDLLVIAEDAGIVETLDLDALRPVVANSGFEDAPAFRQGMLLIECCHGLYLLADA